MSDNYVFDLSDIEISSLANTFINALMLVDEPKCPEIPTVEYLKLHYYIDKSYKGNILPYNKETQLSLRLEDEKVSLPSLIKEDDVYDLVQKLNNISVSENQSYTAGIVIQLVTRFLVYSLKFRRCMSAVPNERLASAVSALSDYRSALLDLANPFTTLPCNVLITDFLAKTQDLLKLPFNPYTDPTNDVKAAISGISPFQITGGAIQPFDNEASFIENLYRQAAGQYKTFDKASHIAGFITPFGFKEYIRHRIPMKRVINGAYICYVDPLNKTYYYTTLVLDEFRFKILKNLLIYEITSGKAAYIHSALYFYMSMCTSEEDFNLMKEYGVISWGFPMKGYEKFRELMDELLNMMYCWKFSNTWSWHSEMVKIAKFKVKKQDSSNWNDFAETCYTGGLLKQVVASAFFKSLST
ncbi:6781_t:CDS:2 [Dentiscutata erythropus]|uniref:6781_t:CDS:1 n=1 Tax=Dentiscutata erythropus TaxID=1348616 RepID=A0A9N9AHH8_9GLOM|nr:6781_t:CDS:2 [Dentiscutata erythropus]